MKRTAAIVILAVLAVFAGLAAVVDTLRYLNILFSPLRFIFSPFLGAGLSALIAFIWFWAASRIWNLDPRGWSFLVIVAAFYLIFDLIALVMGTPIELLLNSIFISILALVLGLLPSTKREFGQG